MTPVPSFISWSLGLPNEAPLSGREVDMDYNIKRIPSSLVATRGKDYLTPDEVNKLLTGHIIVEEKLDGKQVQLEIADHVFIAEDLRVMHTVPYNLLPSYYILLDVWSNKGKRFLTHDERKILLDKWNYSITFPPVIARYGYMNTSISPDEMIQRYIGMSSCFSSKSNIEGIVVKNYGSQMFGKIVDPMFEDVVDNSVHPLKRKPMFNMLTCNTRLCNRYKVKKKKEVYYVN